MKKRNKKGRVKALPFPLKDKMIHSPIKAKNETMEVNDNGKL